MLSVLRCGTVGMIFRTCVFGSIMRSLYCWSFVVSLAAMKMAQLTLWTPKAVIVLHQVIRGWYTGRWWVGCYIWYDEEGPGRAAAPPSPLLAVPNVTAHPSTASVGLSVTVLLCDGPLQNRRFHVQQPTFLFPLETPLRLSPNMFHGWMTIECLPNTSQHVPVYL